MDGFARPAFPLEEGVWVQDIQAKYYNQLKTKADFVIDHRKATGFEMYGPRGLSSYLDKEHIPYAEINKDLDLTSLVGYPAFPQIEQKLKDIAARYPNITKLFSVGKSIKGRDLYFIKISKILQLMRIFQNLNIFPPCTETKLPVAN